MVATVCLLCLSLLCTARSSICKLEYATAVSEYACMVMSETHNLLVHAHSWMA